MTKIILIITAGLILTACSTNVLMEESKTVDVAEVLETPIIKRDSDFQNKIGNNEEHFIGNAEAPITVIVYEDFQ